MKMQKFFLTLALFLSIIFSANAQAVSPGTYTITNKNSSLCLAIRGATQRHGEECTQWTCDGNADKNWKLIDAGNGYFKIQNQNSNHFLAVGGSSRDRGGRCLQSIDTGQPDIIWRFIDAGAGWYKIQNRNSGLFLAIGGGARTGGADLIQWGDEGQEDVKWKLTLIATITLPPGALITRLNTQLTGYVDMHTHPMSHLGFGGKLIHGAPDVDILVPAIPSGNGCRHYTRAANINEALCSCKATHGGYGLFDNTCGDDLRKAILRSTEGNLHARSGHHEEGAQGFPAFSGWPAYNDITHQQMWIDWIKRTYQHGLRVMVALTVNNATLAAAVSGTGDRNADDVSSSNIQIDEMKRMVARHNGSAGSVDDWMEIAYTASDIRRIVRANKLAIILGMEVDNIGNFNKNTTINPNSLTPATTQVVRSEIQRIYNQGVRYIFPIHLVDNKFGGTAVYEDMFNLSNYHQSGRHWDIVCANPADGITKKFVVAGFDAPLAAAKAKIGVDAFRNPPTPPNCSGHVNNLGLTPLGEYAIKEMMKLGMMIDVDHMSKKSMDKTLEIANSVTAGGYPLNAGHNGIRTGGGSERSLSLAQAQTIMRLGGVIGVGCSKTKAYDFVGNFLRISGLLGGDNARLAIGTDINGFEQGPPPTPGSNLVVYDASFPMCTTGSKSWNYNTVGVAHYGLLPDFFKDVQTTSYGISVYEKLMKSAEYFAQMWEKCERQKTNVR
ncbi:MAG TPA: RICIN domain-containing protein [Haliscomenobacter sp.]|uniref:RICIN domain-containing protein n=1 Tax=Haliscomenobacter sp. TaxID=2717303 RepID=UPI002C512787|nr:RICIN domain-containing protein [Haliscomenobacter sp.]HOY21013.1 RICIN domain-containing protein [Haliscomenobacter sp.]